MKIGLKSTALYMQNDAKPWFVGFTGVMVGCLSLAGVMADQTWPYYLGVGGVTAHLAHQVSYLLSYLHIGHYLPCNGPC